MSIIRYQPSSLLHSLHDEMNRMFDQNWDLANFDKSTSATSQWKPHVDIKEDPDKFIVLADIPGVEPQDIQVSYENGALTIQGERKTEKSEEKENFSRLERFYGSFYRQFSLPDNINADAIKAKSKHGVLELTIPKVEKAQSKQIEVSGEN